MKKKKRWSEVEGMSKRVERKARYKHKTATYERKQRTVSQPASQMRTRKLSKLNKK
jgi:hypothetical protein